jgi:hypothetical protein
MPSEPPDEIALAATDKRFSPSKTRNFVGTPMGKNMRASRSRAFYAILGVWAGRD